MSETRAIEFRETIDYVHVVNDRLLDIARKRAELDYSTKISFEKTVQKYYLAANSLHIIMLPGLRGKSGELLSLARKLIAENKFIEAVRKVDEAVEEMIKNLYDVGLLIREERLRVGVVKKI